MFRTARELIPADLDETNLTNEKMNRNLTGWTWKRDLAICSTKTNKSSFPFDQSDNWMKFDAKKAQKLELYVNMIDKLKCLILNCSNKEMSQHIGQEKCIRSRE